MIVRWGSDGPWPEPGEGRPAISPGRSQRIVGASPRDARARTNDRGPHRARRQPLRGHCTAAGELDTPEPQLGNRLIDHESNVVGRNLSPVSSVRVTRDLRTRAQHLDSY